MVNSSASGQVTSIRLLDSEAEVKYRVIRQGDIPCRPDRWGANVIVSYREIDVEGELPRVEPQSESALVVRIRTPKQYRDLMQQISEMYQGYDISKRMSWNGHALLVVVDDEIMSAVREQPEHDSHLISLGRSVIDLTLPASVYDNSPESIIAKLAHARRIGANARG